MEDETLNHENPMPQEKEVSRAEESSPGETAPVETVPVDTPASSPDEAEKEYTHKTMARLKREMLKSRQEAQVLREKLKESEAFSARVGQSALEQYKANAAAMLEKAQMAKMQAHELSDTAAMVNADEELAKAAAQLQWAQTLPTALPPDEKQPAQHQDVEDAPVETHPAAARWIQSHAWIDHNSPSYDHEKASHVVAYATALENQLVQQGREHEINTPGYFRALETYGRYYDGQRGKNKMMKDVSTVAPGKGLQSKTPSTEPEPLTEREKKFCENAGFDEKEYLKHRDLDRKQQAMRKGDGRYER